MKIAHTVIVTPHLAGIYETTHDLVVAERKLGINAFIIDPQKINIDRGVPIGYIDFNKIDIIINHSGLGIYEKIIYDKKIPIIHCMHGRPESSFRLEENKKSSVYSFLNESVQNPNFKAWVTFWPEFITYWSLIIPQEKLYVVTAPVDLNEWTPNGLSGYKFSEQKGVINIVCTDMWREDITPYHIIHGFCEFAKNNHKIGSECKLHLYGVNNTSALNIILQKIKENGWLGEVKGIVNGLQNIYRAATFTISPHKIATRSIRESLACGCPVIAPAIPFDGKFLPSVDNPILFAKWMSLQFNNLNSNTRINARQYAEKYFDSNKTAKEILQLINKVLKEC